MCSIILCVYDIVPGKLIQWEKLDVQPNAENLRLSAIDCDTNEEI